MTPTTPRLDLNREMVDKAKRAMLLRLKGRSPATAGKGKRREATKKELEKIRFSDTLTTAAKTYTNKVISLLDRAGFRKYPPLKSSEKRPRRVDVDTWDELGRVAEDQGITRMALVRGLLNLLADEYDQHKAKKSSKATTPRKGRKAGASSEKRRSGK